MEMLERSRVLGLAEIDKTLTYGLVEGFYFDMCEGLEEAGFDLVGGVAGVGNIVREYRIGGLDKCLRVKLFLVQSHLFGGAVCYSVFMEGDEDKNLTPKRIRYPLGLGDIWESVRQVWCSTL